MICCSCGVDKPLKQFGSEPQRLGGRPVRCKLCTAEGVKRSIRYNKMLPLLSDALPSWPAVKIESEIEWLEAKLALLREALESRRNRA